MQYICVDVINCFHKGGMSLIATALFPYKNQLFYLLHTFIFYYVFSFDGYLIGKVFDGKKLFV